MKRVKATTPPGQGIAVAVGWYSLRDWRRLKEVAADPEALHKTYREWVDEVERTITTLRNLGTQIEKLDVDVEELQAWCVTQGEPNTGEARARFIAEKNRERGRRF